MNMHVYTILLRSAETTLNGVDDNDDDDDDDDNDDDDDDDDNNYAVE
jgi:hypothetical protein